MKCKRCCKRIGNPVVVTFGHDQFLCHVANPLFKFMSFGMCYSQFPSLIALHQFTSLIKQVFIPICVSKLWNFNHSCFQLKCTSPLQTYMMLLQWINICHLALSMSLPEETLLEVQINQLSLFQPESSHHTEIEHNSPTDKVVYLFWGLGLSVELEREAMISLQI